MENKQLMKLCCLLPLEIKKEIYLFLEFAWENDRRNSINQVNRKTIQNYNYVIKEFRIIYQIDNFTPGIFKFFCMENENEHLNPSHIVYRKQSMKQEKQSEHHKRGSYDWERKFDSRKSKRHYSHRNRQNLKQKIKDYSND